mmetsp:Transcript_4074/g.5723  ORF Transcript_4074/g.5723 Transcript_4074/m.5723 type:complete len:127 (-) Transcript_4074:333-713(-)
MMNDCLSELNEDVFLDDWLIVEREGFEGDNEEEVEMWSSSLFCDKNLSSNKDVVTRKQTLEDTRTAFLAEATRRKARKVSVMETEEIWEIPSWLFSWPAKLVAASTVFITLKLIAAITHRITPRFL